MLLDMDLAVGIQDTCLNEAIPLQDKNGVGLRRYVSELRMEVFRPYECLHVLRVRMCEVPGYHMLLDPGI